MGVPFNSLAAQLAPLQEELRAAADRVIQSGWFLAGPEVAAFEDEFASFAGLPHAVALNSGTDALGLALRGLGLRPGDEVVMPSHTALPCYHAVLAAGGVPVFADVDPDTFCLDPASAAALVGSRTRAVMAVHLYGHPCDMDALSALCADKGLRLVEDCAQAHGATWRGQKVGTFGHAACFSFYPTKNLGALGDAGAVACASPELDAALRRLRQYGETARYESAHAGVNSRMDELQAAFLRVRLAHLDEANAARQELADIYDHGLAGLDLRTPVTADQAGHVHHLYVIRTGQRDALAAFLKDHGLGTAIHYPVPGHMQPLFTTGKARCLAGSLPETESLAGEILSLPLYPGMSRADCVAVCTAVREFYAG